MKLLPAIIRAENYGTSWNQIIYAKAQTVDLNKIGMIATSLSDLFLSEKLEDYLYTYMKYGVAQCMLLGLGVHEAMLAIRELSPYLDLLDGNKKKINNNQWIQTNNTSGDHRSGEKQDTLSVYQTDKESDNDKKVIIIYGFEFLNGFKKTNVDEIQIWRRHVKLLNKFPIDKNKKHPLFKGITYDDGLPDIELLDIEDSSNLPKNSYSILSNRENFVYHNNMMIFNTPILFSRNDRMDIRFVYPNGQAPCLTEVDEEIKIKGLVFENLGESICR